MNIMDILPVLGLPGAISDQAFTSNIVERFIHAGLVVKIVLMILVFFSVISWAIILMKWHFFSRAKRETAYFLDIFWDNNDLAALYKETDDLKYSPITQVYRTGYTELARVNKMINTSPSNIETGLNGFSEKLIPSSSFS